MLHAAFWLSLACVGYTYVGYPLILVLAARWRCRPVRHADVPAPTVSILIAAYNEEINIGRRVREFLRALDDWPSAGEILIVSDGSTDRTADLVRQHSDPRLRLIALTENRGKAHALSLAADHARHEVLVLADARQRWDAASLERLVQPLSDPEVGAVSGELVMESAAGVLEGVGLYWRLEKRMRVWESQWHSTVGVTGCIAAVRRTLFRPIPTGTVLDDVYWPLRVVMEGRRVVFSRDARAYDRSTAEVSGEFRRKVRTLSGNLQLITLLPGAFLPWRNPVWFQLVSHKLARLLAPWALIGLLATSIALDDWPSRTLLALQAAAYSLALIGLISGSTRLRIPTTAAAFLVLNAAATVALWVWLTGRVTTVWRKQRYG